MNSDPTARIEAIAAVIAEPLPFEYSDFLSRCGGFVSMDVDNGYVIHTPEAAWTYIT